MSTLPYLHGYPGSLLSQVMTLIEQDRPDKVLQKRYSQGHDVNSNKTLYQYTQDSKARSLHGVAPISKVMYDSKIHVLNNALGLHTAISCVQGGKLEAKVEVRVTMVFRNAPEALLRMTVVHELAHLREKDHNKTFYQLYCRTEPQYHQLESDTRPWLTYLSLNRSAQWRTSFVVMAWQGDDRSPLTEFTSVYDTFRGC